MASASLPQGWESDYDGSRWFFRYKATGLVQFHFPKPGDEFPEFYDYFGPAQSSSRYEPTPEERLESDRQVRQLTGVPKAARQTAKKTVRKPSNAMSATLDAGDLLYSSYEMFGYFSPEAYTDVSPECGDDDDNSNGSDVRASPQCGVRQPAKPDKTDKLDETDRPESSNTMFEAPGTSFTVPATPATAASPAAPIAVPAVEIHELPDAATLGGLHYASHPVGHISELAAMEIVVPPTQDGSPSPPVEMLPVELPGDAGPVVSSNSIGSNSVGEAVPSRPTREAEIQSTPAQATVLPYRPSQHAAGEATGRASLVLGSLSIAESQSLELAGFERARSAESGLAHGNPQEGRSSVPSVLRPSQGPSKRTADATVPDEISSTVCPEPLPTPVPALAHVPTVLRPASRLSQAQQQQQQQQKRPPMQADPLYKALTPQAAKDTRQSQEEPPLRAVPLDLDILELSESLLSLRMEHAKSGSDSVSTDEARPPDPGLMPAPLRFSRQFTPPTPSSQAPRMPEGLDRDNPFSDFAELAADEASPAPSKPASPAPFISDAAPAPIGPLPASTGAPRGAPRGAPKGPPPASLGTEEPVYVMSANFGPLPPRPEPSPPVRPAKAPTGRHPGLLAQTNATAAPKGNGPAVQNEQPQQRHSATSSAASMPLNDGSAPLAQRQQTFIRKPVGSQSAKPTPPLPPRVGHAPRTLLSGIGAPSGSRPSDQEAPTGPPTGPRPGAQGAPTGPPTGPRPGTIPAATPQTAISTEYSLPGIMGTPTQEQPPAPATPTGRRPTQPAPAQEEIPAPAQTIHSAPSIPSPSPQLPHQSPVSSVSSPHWTPQSEPAQILSQSPPPPPPLPPPQSQPTPAPAPAQTEQQNAVMPAQSGQLPPQAAYSSTGQAPGQPGFPFPRPAHGYTMPISHSAQTGEQPQSAGLGPGQPHLQHSMTQPLSGPGMTHPGTAQQQQQQWRHSYIPQQQPTQPVQNMYQASPPAAGNRNSSMFSKIMSNPTLKKTAYAMGGKLVSEGLGLGGAVGAKIGSSIYQSREDYKKQQARLQQQQHQQQQQYQQFQQAQQYQHPQNAQTQQGQYQHPQNAQTQQGQYSQHPHNAQQASWPAQSPYGTPTSGSPMSPQPQGAAQQQPPMQQQQPGVFHTSAPMEAEIPSLGTYRPPFSTLPNRPPAKPPQNFQPTVAGGSSTDTTATAAENPSDGGPSLVQSLVTSLLKPSNLQQQQQQQQQPAFDPQQFSGSQQQNTAPPVVDPTTFDPSQFFSSQPPVIVPPVVDSSAFDPLQFLNSQPATVSPPVIDPSTFDIQQFIGSQQPAFAMPNLDSSTFDIQQFIGSQQPAFAPPILDPSSLFNPLGTDPSQLFASAMFGQSSGTGTSLFDPTTTETVNIDVETDFGGVDTTADFTYTF